MRRTIIVMAAKRPLLKVLLATAAATLLAVTSTATGKQCCQMAKFDPFLSLDCAGVEGVGWGHIPRKGRDQILQRSVAEP